MPTSLTENNLCFDLNFSLLAMGKTADDEGDTKEQNKPLPLYGTTVPLIAKMHIFLALDCLISCLKHSVTYLRLLEQC